MSVVGSAGTVTFQFGAQGTQIALQAIKSIDTQINTLSGSLQKFMASMGSMSAGTMPQFFQQLGTGAEQASTKTQTFVERMSGFQGNLLTAATSVGTFTASIFGIDAAMDGLTQSEISLEQARVRQDRMQTTLQAQEQRLNDLRTSGTATAEAIAVQEERVNTTRQQVEVQTERVAFQQQNLSEQYAQFGAQILPQVITASLSGVTAMTSLVNLIGKSQKAVELLNKAFSVFKGGSQIVEATGAFSNLSAELTKSHQASLLFSSAFGAVKPYLAGVAIGIAEILVPLALYATNFLGARDAMHAAGQTIGDTIPQFKGMLEALETTGRQFTTWAKGLGDSVLSIENMSDAIDVAKGNITADIDQISDQMLQFVSEVKGSMESLADPSTFDFAEETFTKMFGDEEGYVKAAARFDLITKSLLDMNQTLDEGGLKSAVTAENIVGTMKSMTADISAYIQTMGTEGSKGLDLINERMNIFLADIKNKPPAEVEKTIRDFLNDIATIFSKYGPEITEKINKAIMLDFAPVTYHLTEIQEKLAALKLPPELALQTTRFTENIKGMVDATVEQIDTLALSDAQMMKIAYAALPAMTKGLQKNHPEIKTNADTLQYLVDNVDAATAKANPLLQAFLLLADGADINKTKTAELTEKLTEEEQKLADLAKAYFDLNLTSSEAILEKKAQIEWVENAIQKYDDEIESLKELQIEYGSNEAAVYGVNQATMDLIESKKQQIINEQALTVAAIDVTKALDDSTESQILLNDAVIEGVKAAADFVTELAKGEKQTEAYGKALAANVMDVLKKMPEAIGDFADAFKETLPNLFQSLDEFQGKIKPFDKQSIKDYKEELKDLDVPKSLRDLYVSSAKVWQDKDEIIKEGEALFAGMAGSLVHNFEEIDVKDVTKFLDEIGGRLTEMEAQGVGTAFTGNIRTLIDHIKNSSDPVQELLEHFDALKGAMDPAAIDVVSTSVKVFGTNMSDIISKSLLGDLTKETNEFQQAINKLGQEDLQKLAADVGAYMTGIRGEITGPNPQTEFTPERLKEIEDARQAEKAITIAQNKLKAQPTELTTAWQNAATAIDTATAQISLSVGTMADTVGTGILANVTSVAGLGTIWQQTSTNIGTYAPAITEATNTMSTTSVTAFNNTSVALGAYDKAFGILKTDVDTNTKAMTTATDAWSTGSITSFDNTSVALGAFDKAVKILEETVKTSTDNMLTETKEWETEMVKSFKAVKTGADEAATAVGNLFDAVDKLEDKTITVTMKVEEKGGSTGNNQSGGVELLTGTKMFTGGEGRKPEIHFFFPLDEMAQSHAKSEFTLPFSIADLGLSRAGPATLMGKPSNQPTIPSNLVSNLRLNANLHIDLGNEIKKIVREEINAIAVTRLDRMAF